MMNVDLKTRCFEELHGVYLGLINLNVEEAGAAESLLRSISEARTLLKLSRGLAGGQEGQALQFCLEDMDVARAYLYKGQAREALTFAREILQPFADRDAFPKLP